LNRRLEDWINDEVRKRLEKSKKLEEEQFKQREHWINEVTGKRFE